MSTIADQMRARGLPETDIAHHEAGAQRAIESWSRGRPEHAEHFRDGHARRHHWLIYINLDSGHQSRNARVPVEVFHHLARMRDAGASRAEILKWCYAHKIICNVDDPGVRQ